MSPYLIFFLALFSIIAGVVAFAVLTIPLLMQRRRTDPAVVLIPVGLVVIGLVGLVLPSATGGI